MAVINRVPQGFLSFFDAKTLGRTPGDTAGNLQPTIDGFGFYAADLPLQTDVAFLSTITAPGNSVAVTVPDGELWLVYALSGRVTTITNTFNGQFAISINDPVNNAFVQVGQTEHIDPAAPILPGGNQHSASVKWDYPLFAPPGTEFLQVNHTAQLAAVRFDLGVYHRTLTV